MSVEKKPFLLRLDKKLYDQYQKWSDDELRSLNSQIEYVLRNALREAGRDSYEHSVKPIEKQISSPKRK